jgi:hypothetical protein
MIALAAAMRLRSGVETPGAAAGFAVRPRWPLEEVSIAAEPACAR